MAGTGDRHAQPPSRAGLLERLRAQSLVEVVALGLGGRIWRIEAVTDQTALIGLAEERDNVPYGYLLWESAVALAERLQAEPFRVRGKRVLELGAGGGLTGLVAQSLGAQVTQTDHEPGVLEIARGNARLNGIEGIETFVADWRTWTPERRYDVILGADIVYDNSAWGALERIFQRNLVPGGAVLLADPGRVNTLAFVAGLERRGWTVELTMAPVVLPLGERRPVEVSLFVLGAGNAAQQASVPDAGDN